MVIERYLLRIYLANPLTPEAELSFLGGDDGIRTHDPLLAGQVLSQLSYTPIGLLCHRSPLCRGLRCVGIDLSSRTVAREVLSAQQSLTSVFGMGTGGPFALKTPTIQNP